MERFAEDCANLLDVLNIHAPIVICGLSMGGYVSLSFYRQYPYRVSGLVLAATRSGADTIAVKANRDGAIQIAVQNGSTAIADSMLPKMFAEHTYRTKPELIALIREMMANTSVEGVIGALSAMRDRSDSTDMLPSIHIPTLILHGSNDQLIPVSMAQEMHMAIPFSKIAILPEAGHLLNLEQPKMFNQAVSEFVTSNPHLV